MKTRVVLVDDHLSWRQMLAVSLAREGGYEIVGQAGNGLDALRICREVPHEVVILDLLLPELCGLEVLRRLRVESPRSRVLVFSSTVDRLRIVETLRLHPHGFITKNDHLETLYEALRAVAAGRTYFSCAVTPCAREAHEPELTELTRREKEVLQLVAESRSSKQIAARLGLSVKTVENHRAHLMEKLDRHDVAALTRYAMRAGFVSAD